jgi:hypothetical protein
MAYCRHYKIALDGELNNAQTKTTSMSILLDASGKLDSMNASDINENKKLELPGSIIAIGIRDSIGVLSPGAVRSCQNIVFCAKSN